MKGGRGVLVLSDSCLFIGRIVQLEQRNQAMNNFIGCSGGDGGYGAWGQCAERAYDAVALASFAGERHGAAGMQGRTVGAAGGGGCNGVGVRKIICYEKHNS